MAKHSLRLFQLLSHELSGNKIMKNAGYSKDFGGEYSSFAGCVADIGLGEKKQRHQNRRLCFNILYFNTPLSIQLSERLVSRKFALLFFSNRGL